jgi:NAD(P)H-flavin reductase
MSNKPSPELRPIRAMQPEGESATLLSLDLQGSALAALHQHPGQYVQLSAPGGPQGYFALANAPGRPPGVFEVLVKEGGAAADAIRKTLLPAELLVSAPMGPGFPLEKAQGKALLCSPWARASAPSAR